MQTRGQNVFIVEKRLREHETYSCYQRVTRARFHRTHIGITCTCISHKQEPYIIFTLKWQTTTELLPVACDRVLKHDNFSSPECIYLLYIERSLTWILISVLNMLICM